MIKRSFFSLGKPELKYPVVHTQEQDVIRVIPIPNRITFFLKNPYESDEGLIIRPGDRVKTGQKLKLREDETCYVISSVTGTITGISEYKGYFGKPYMAISIDTVDEDQWDDKFKKDQQKPTLETSLEFLGCLPGDTGFIPHLDTHSPLNTIIINGVDTDLLVSTNQLIVQTETDNLKTGIAYLAEIAGADEIMITMTPDLASQAGETGADVKVIDPIYPNTLPEMMMKHILGKTPPADKTWGQIGVGLINAEAVVAYSKAFTKGQIPVNKLLTVINKDHTSLHVRARVGTHVKDILAALDIETHHGDQLVLGGPMTGHALYSEDLPILPDTDAIMVHDKDNIVLTSDCHCINCGECVRACPARIPVNMLIRVLENGLYEEAAKEYDLLSCIECGLCSYVCTARIPIFHYIMLGKYEFARIETVEEPNA
jgi:electron transport complex protein RnfC